MAHRFARFPFVRSDQVTDSTKSDGHGPLVRRGPYRVQTVLGKSSPRRNKEASRVFRSSVDHRPFRTTISAMTEKSRCKIVATWSSPSELLSDNSAIVHAVHEVASRSILCGPRD